MGYQWLMQWIPFHDVMFHVIMGQVMLIFPGALWMLIRYRKNRPQLSERMLFTPISNANIKMAVAVIISAYPVVVILNRFSMFFVKNQVMEVVPYMIPIVIVVIITMLLIVFVPSIASWLPNAVM